MNDDVYIHGIDMIKFGRFPDLSVPELASESILLALDDANLNMGDIEAFYCGNIKEVNRMVGQKTLQLVGQTGIPIVIAQMLAPQVQQHLERVGCQSKLVYMT